MWHHQPPLYDEPLFISNMPLFNRYGLSATFLREMDNQAPGPLYELMHYPLQAITHMQPPGLRMVNIVLLWCIILFLAIILKRQYNLGWEQALVPALSMMALPVVWPVAGMALTEIPPMCCAMLSVLLLQRALACEGRSWFLLLFTLLAGVALGLAIWGRSPFLVMVPAAGLLLWQQAQRRQRWIIVCLYVSVGLAMSVPVFLIWHGLMPPKQALVTAEGFKIWHGILAFAYGGLLTLIIAPRWFYFNRRIAWLLVATMLILTLLNITLLHYTDTPMTAVVKRIGSNVFVHIFSSLVPPLLATAALYFGVCSLLRTWEERHQPFTLFMLASGFLLLLSCAKITHLFSSRYVAQATPFLVLGMMGFDKISYGKCVRFAIGAGLGLVSLESYFSFH
ncbi:ArnT family glycosyltransferase [Chitinophaga parva]|nr:glycosyltransferase family 39 protein [Chitinophaga parva]